MTAASPSVGSGQAEEHQDRRGLAGAVLPEEAEDLARIDLEIELVDRGQRAVPLREPPGPDDRLGSVALSRRRHRYHRPGGCRRERCPDPAHRRPNRRKTNQRPTRTIAIRPIPMTPQNVDVWMVTRISVEAVATGAVAVMVAT